MGAATLTSMLRSIAVLTLALLSFSACRDSKTPELQPPLVLSSMNLYPLRPGNAWSYEVETGERSPTLAVTRVESLRGSIATVRTGQTTLKYEIRQEGVYVVSDSAWLFRGPFEQGASWPARGDRTAVLVSTNTSIQTPAGTFQGCLEIVETGGSRALEVRTVYCPFIGPVAVDSTMKSDVSDRVLTVRARLRGYEVGGEESPAP